MDLRNLHDIDASLPVLPGLRFTMYCHEVVHAIFEETSQIPVCPVCSLFPVVLPIQAYPIDETRTWIQASGSQPASDQSLEGPT